jgi:hypothetical protein
MGNWKGWEYETANGLHIYQSKRHYFTKKDQAVCGIRPPSRIGAHTGEGDGICKKCDNILRIIERGKGG